MSHQMEMALLVLEDCLEAGDNPEHALATVADDHGVASKDLAAEFEQEYGESYLTYAQ